MLSYLLKVMLIYSLVFTGIFHLVRTTKSIESYKRSATYATLYLVATFLATQAVRFSLGWVDIPDGRYLMIAFAGYYLGFWPVVALISLMLSVTALVLPYRLAGLLVIQVTLGLIFYVFGRRYYRKHKQIHHREMLVAVLLIVVIPLVLSNVFFPNDNYVSLANENLAIIVFTTYVIVFTVLKSVNSEIEREQYLVQMEEDKSVLQHQNDEIMALNEEMYATEETLRENYDELERYKNRVEHYAFHDAKTGFYNSDYLLNMLHAKMNAKELKPYKLLAINICDLDDYREKLGQMLFEMLHYQVGTVLQSVIENEDQQKYITLFVVTYGQYAMLSEGCDRDELNRLLHLAYEKLQRLEIIDEVNLNITISVGGVEVENTDMKPEEQLEYAEAASLEAACQTGAIKRHHEIYWFYADLLEAKKFKTKLSIDLKHNLNLREFYVVYQPQYNVNHQIVSAEALLRWRHPELGEISPAVFVALAEKQGVIHKLGAFVQEQAMEMQKEMMIRHPNTPLRPIAINVSLIELMDSDYFDDLIQRLEDYQVPPQAIALEITESSVYNQLEDVLINIRRLNEAGVAIHLDDFGTGYASISHLNLFPLSVIKIDKTFIDHVANTTQQKTKTVVFSMIDMAHRLSLPVVAEGVETKAQFDALKEMGCDLFQGYYFSRPIRSEEWSERG